MSVRWSKTTNDPAGIATAASEGFDGVELTVDYVMSISDEQFILQKNQFLQLNLIPEVCNSILPTDVMVTEKGFNLYVWTEYLKKAIHRLSELNCQKLVWSNGRARVLPWEGDTSEIKGQVLQFLHVLGELSGKHNITILLEPLGPRRTNYLNSMKAIKEFLPLIRDDNISSVISLREMSEIDLLPEQFPEYSELIRHVYLENPQQTEGKRISPRSDDEYDYRSFFSALKRIQYEGVINLPEDADSDTLQYCRKLWSE
ncbi:MAG: hypothetical protein HQM13_09315 [SAR324 cluster bacterium]|nr:hypothetical protein [SAR324 cluster bacterium]